jgi:hypothetical protein
MARADDRGVRPPPVWRGVVLCAGVAVWIDLGTIHRGHDADSLLSVLVSLLRWTPFFWEQDRFGMLVPLLALPARNPLVNLLVQDFLDLTCGLATFFLLSRYVLRDGSYPVVAAVGAAAFLALTPAPYRFMYLVNASYGVWLALGLGGLLLAEPTAGSRRRRLARRAAALGLMILAHWVNFSTAVLLAPLVVFRLLFVAIPRARARGRAWPLLDPETGAALLLLAAGYAAGAGMRRLSPDYEETPYGRADLALWPRAWYRLALEHWAALAPAWYPAFLALAAALGLLALAWPRVRRYALAAWQSAAAPASASAVTFLVVGTLEWTRRNDYAFRYLIPSVVLLQAALVTVAVGPVWAALGPRTRRRLGLGTAPVLLAAAAWSYGSPSLSGVRRDLDRALGSMTPDLLAARCTHLAGNYWKVWPAVFHANLTHNERGDGRRVWGITHRCEVTRPFWSAVPLDEARFAIPLGDPEGEAWLKAFQLTPLVEVERRSAVRVLRPRDARPAGSAPR